MAQRASRHKAAADVLPADRSAAIEALFAYDGALAAAIAGFELRPEQRAMALGVANALAANQSLLAEAGTGTGKTLAYLAPVLLSGGPVVVSTATKNLQEQLLFEDVPRLSKALGRPIGVELLKGRTNYLCRKRGERVFAQGILPGSAAELERVREWREVTQTGDLNEVTDNASLFAELTATREQCTGRSCAHFDACWVMEMRRRAQTAELLIVNHHLYLADLALRHRSPDIGLLPPHELVVFDEAHELEDVASQHFGVHVSDWQLRQLTKDVISQLSEHGDAQTAERIGPLLAQIELRTRQLFDTLPFSAARRALDLDALARNEALLQCHAALDTALAQLQSILATHAEEEIRGWGQTVDQLAADLGWLLNRPLRAGAEQEVTRPEADSTAFVRYTETTPRSRALVARPLETASLLRAGLDGRTCIFVSATLRVGQSFGHIKRQLGQHDALELAVDSPFDYANQTRLFIPSDLPTPDAPSYPTRVAEHVETLVSASAGGAFVLCTSHRTLQFLAQQLRRRTPLRILVQGSEPKSRLLEAFRDDGNAVLLGSLSFWRGVDVPGQALRVVIMDKLPFASPQDPLVQARVQAADARGESGFRHVQLPHAALLLRQGFGRLIRHSDDKGLVAVLDPRLTQKGYGRTLLRALPQSPLVEDLQAAAGFASTLPHATPPFGANGDCS